MAQTTHTAQILAFPRATPVRPAATIEDAVASARRVLQPHALDLSRAVPGDDAEVEALRRQTRAVIAARTQDDRAELVSALLLALEAAPLTPCHCYPVRELDGQGQVVATVGELIFKLRPDDARTAASALFHEQAFAGCAGVAADLREAAARAEIRTAHGGPLDGHTGPRTGFASTLILAALICAMIIVSALADRAQGVL